MSDDAGHRDGNFLFTLSGVSGIWKDGAEYPAKRAGIVQLTEVGICSLA